MRARSTGTVREIQGPQENCWGSLSLGTTVGHTRGAGIPIVG